MRAEPETFKTGVLNSAVIIWAYRQPIEDRGTKAVLVALAASCDQSGRAAVAIAALASMTSQSRRTVARRLKKLVEARLVRRERQSTDNGARDVDCFLFI